MNFGCKCRLYGYLFFEFLSCICRAFQKSQVNKGFFEKIDKQIKAGRHSSRQETVAGRVCV